MPNAHLNRIHALRGIAALLVLALHVSLWDARAGAPIMPPGPGLGWVGVDIFFVLSGFIIVYATRASGSGLSAATGFFVQRAGRIFPAYWAVLGPVLVLALIAPGMAGDDPNADILLDLALLPSSARMAIAPAWTLVHEMHFYLVFTLLMLFARRRLPAALMIWAGVIGLAGLLPNLPASPYLKLAANPLNLMFLLGAGVALAMEAGWRAPMARTLAVLSALGVAGGAVLLHATDWKTAGFGEWARVVFCGAPAAGLIFALATRDCLSAWTPPAALARLGDWSYALYLVNYPIIFVCGALIAGPDGAALSKACAILAAAILSFVAAIMLHHAIEKPAQAGAKALARKITTPRAPASPKGWQMS
jgi:peptidoglycan/LPS O-acetylase OafA/YrhL